MELLLDILSWALILAGAAFCVIGGVGVLRFPDVYTRMHAAGVVDTTGAGFLLVGLMLQGGLSQITIKLILILLFLLVTSPTASHALAKAAYVSGVRPRLGPEPSKNADPDA